MVITVITIYHHETCCKKGQQQDPLSINKSMGKGHLWHVMSWKPLLVAVCKEKTGDKRLALGFHVSIHEGSATLMLQDIHGDYNVVPKL